MWEGNPLPYGSSKSYSLRMEGEVDRGYYSSTADAVPLPSQGKAHNLHNLINRREFDKISTHDISSVCCQEVAKPVAFPCEGRCHPKG